MKHCLIIRHAISRTSSRSDVANRPTASAVRRDRYERCERLNMAYPSSRTLRLGSCARGARRQSRRRLRSAYQYFSAESTANGTRRRPRSARRNRALADASRFAPAPAEYHAFEQRDRGDAADRDQRAIGNRIQRLIVEQTREFSDVRGGAAPAIGANYIHSELPSSLVRPARHWRIASALLCDFGGGVGHADVHCAQSRQRGVTSRAGSGSLTSGRRLCEPDRISDGASGRTSGGKTRARVRVDDGSQQRRGSAIPRSFMQAQITTAESAGLPSNIPVRGTCRSACPRPTQRECRS